MTQHFGNQAGGVVLEFRSPCGGSISLWLDGAEAPAAQWQLPEAKQWRRQLFALPKPLSGEHACEWRPEGGAELKNWTIHQQEEMVVGRNPLTGMDFPDVDMIRVGDTYYMISTTMYFMPGAVILRSYDLINWEYCTRIYDVLEDTPRQRLDEGNAYSAGMWAATLRFHKGRFYVIFVANDTHKTYLYRADDIMGPWQKSEMEGFYHDCSLLFDDDERVYLVYGGKEIHLLELNAELTGPEPGGLNRIIADSGDSEFLGYEGSHLYKINGKYYLFVIHSLRERWWRVETCLMSESLTGAFRGGIEMDDKAKSVTLDGEPVNLTPTEYDILKLFLQHPGVVISPKDIYRKVWNDAPYGAESTVAVHIRHLREKLEINPAEPRYLKVVWGQGYKLEKGNR